MISQNPALKVTCHMQITSLVQAISSQLLLWVILYTRSPADASLQHQSAAAKSIYTAQLQLTPLEIGKQEILNTLLFPVARCCGFSCFPDWCDLEMRRGKCHIRQEDAWVGIREAGQRGGEPFLPCNPPLQCPPSKRGKHCTLVCV